ncbi:hypothetical protein DJ94_4639 [Bacillus pseudomycoides]|nr:hypothetical protein DJ94_4639 [Bacillus pseudomycoides]
MIFDGPSLQGANIKLRYPVERTITPILFYGSV